MNSPAQHPSRRPIVWAKHGLVWVCIAWVILAGLMAVSPAIHASFCLHENAHQQHAEHCHDTQHAPESGDQETAGDDCVAMLFRAGFIGALLLIVLNAHLSARTLPRLRWFTPFRLSACAGLLPPPCGPPLGAG